MTALDASHRRALHAASLITKAPIVGLVATVITAMCAATPAEAATGRLDVTFQGSGGLNPYIASDVGSKTLTWNGDATCLTITVPADANVGFSAANHTDEPMAVYFGNADCQGVPTYIEVGQTSMGTYNSIVSFQPLH